MNEDMIKAIMVEAYKAMEKLGAKSDLLGTMGSFGDTLSDEEVLDFLKMWNEG